MALHPFLLEASPCGICKNAAAAAAAAANDDDVVKGCVSGDGEVYVLCFPSTPLTLLLYIQQEPRPVDIDTYSYL